MRTCCCCVPVNVGAMILGIIGFSICALELVGLIPYELQLNVFNPIQDFVGLDFATLKYHLEVFAKDHAVDNDTLEILKGKLDEYLPPIFLGATVEAGVYAVSCLLMLIGKNLRVFCPGLFLAHYAPVVQFHEIFVTKIMNELIYLFILFLVSQTFVKLHKSEVIFFVKTKFREISVSKQLVLDPVLPRF